MKAEFIWNEERLWCSHSKFPSGFRLHHWWHRSLVLQHGESQSVWQKKSVLAFALFFFRSLLCIKDPVYSNILSRNRGFFVSRLFRFDYLQTAHPCCHRHCVQPWTSWPVCSNNLGRFYSIGEFVVDNFGHRAKRLITVSLVVLDNDRFSGWRFGDIAFFKKEDCAISPLFFLFLFFLFSFMKRW